MKRIFYGIILTIVVVSVAYIAGTEAGEYFQEKKISQTTEQVKKDITESILSQMNDLKIGDKLPDYSFETLAFEPIMLSSLIHDKTILFFIQPDCPSCIYDIAKLSSFVKTQRDASRFIIISSGNPRHLMDLRDDYSLTSTILYDHERGYSSIFGIFTYPFHIVIDKDMRVLEIIASPLEDSDYTGLLE